MKQIIVRYKVKPDQAEKNQQLIEQVFAELNKTQPPGLRYASFRQEDGVSFVHVASIETEDGANPLAQSPAFQAFQAGINERCEEPPVATEMHAVGAYGMF